MFAKISIYLQNVKAWQSKRQIQLLYTKTYGKRKSYGKTGEKIGAHMTTCAGAKGWERR
jgi:hypothetical protein